MNVRIMFVSAAAAICTAIVGVTSAIAADAGAKGVKTIPLPSGAEAIVAKTDAKGTIHLAWNSPEGPRYAKSLNGGAKFTTPIPIVDRASFKPGLQFHLFDMAVGKENRVHVAMATNAWKLKLPKEEWGFFYASIDATGREFTPVRNINNKPSEGFSLAADDQGNVTACWLSGKLHANVSKDGGKTFAPSVEIDSSYDPCDCCTTSCTYGADGKLAVLYREETNNERDMYLVLWDQSRNQSTRTRISSTLWKIDACPMTYYTVSATPTGYVAAWPTEGKVYFAQLDSTGKQLPSREIKVPGTAGMRSGVLALPAPDGNTLVAWKDQNRLGWQLYDAQGQPSGTPGSSPSTGKGAAGVVDQDGRFILFP